jgi:plastocyanin
VGDFGLISYRVEHAGEDLRRRYSSSRRPSLRRWMTRILLFTPSRRTWHDTLLVEPNETADLAFVADNPGDWMLHCHVTDHQESGMMAVIHVG